MKASHSQSDSADNGIPPKDGPKIITDPALTAETDDLNTDEAVSSPEIGAEAEKADKPEEDKKDLPINNAGIGLNHDENDDLSLN
ncbi:MAG: hypothetical protein V4687_19510 [Bacteroidota bacterium]